MGLKNWIIQKGAAKMFDKLWSILDGKKLYIGGIASILTGLGMVGKSYSEGNGFDKEGWTYILAGWALIGGKSAIDKTSMKVLLVGLFLMASPAKADPLAWNLPNGIGSFQFPMQATEVVMGYDFILDQTVGGASLPVLTLGKLKSGYRLIDGHIGATGAWPTDSVAVDPYGGFGHDFLQDIPILSQFKSAHLNGFGRYSTVQGGWGAGGSFSYSFGGPPSAPVNP